MKPATITNNKDKEKLKTQRVKKITNKTGSFILSKYVKFFKTHENFLWLCNASAECLSDTLVC